MMQYNELKKIQNAATYCMVGSNKNSQIKRYCPSKGKEPSKIGGGVFFCT
jgi:hypothetical protein